MKTYTYLISTSFITILLLMSCSPAHVINPHNVPGFTQAKETKISGSFSAQDLIIGEAGHINFAHSFTDKFAFIGGGSVAQTDWSKMHYANIGLGYYRPLHKDMVFENYIGYGYGSVRDDKARDHSFFYARYSSVFNQSSLTIRSNNELEVVLSWRLSNIHHYNIIDYEGYHNQINNPNTFIIEPGFILRAGDDLKFEAYLNFLNPISNKSKENYGYFSREAVGLGLVYSFKPIDKKI